GTKGIPYPAERASRQTDPARVNPGSSSLRDVPSRPSLLSLRPALRAMSMQHRPGDTEYWLHSASKSPYPGTGWDRPATPEVWLRLFAEHILRRNTSASVRCAASGNQTDPGDA